MKHQLLMVLSVATTVAGCSGAPGEAEMKTAVETQMKQVGGQVKSLRKIGCKEDGSSAYKCDVELEVLAFGMTTKGARTVRFVKASDGWAMTQ